MPDTLDASGCVRKFEPLSLDTRSIDFFCSIRPTTRNENGLVLENMEEQTGRLGRAPPDAEGPTMADAPATMGHDIEVPA